KWFYMSSLLSPLSLPRLDFGCSVMQHNIKSAESYGEEVEKESVFDKAEDWIQTVEGVISDAIYQAKGDIQALSSEASQLIQDLETVNQVRCLDLSGVQLSEASLCKIRATFTNLQELSVANCVLDGLQMNAIASFNQLKKLDLSGCRGLTRDMLSYLHEMESLESIQLEGSDIGITVDAWCTWLHEFMKVNQHPAVVLYVINYFKAVNAGLNFPLVQTVIKRSEEIQAARFEKTAVPIGEALCAALIIELHIKRVASVGQRILRKEQTALAHDLYVDFEGREVYFIAQPENSLLLGEGSYKKVMTAAAFVFDMLYTIPETCVYAETYNEKAHFLEEAKKRDNLRRDAEKEIRIHKSLSGQHGIPKLRSVHEFTTVLSIQGKNIEIPQTAYMIERFDGDLQKFYKVAYSHNEILQIAIDLMCGLACMHVASIVHGDLKLGNALFKRNGRGELSAALADFGFSFDTRIDPPAAIYKKNFYGSLLCTPPELVQLQKFTGDYFKNDVWALGFMLYQLHFRKNPSWSDMLEELYETNGSEALKDEFVLRARDEIEDLWENDVAIPYRELCQKNYLTSQEQFEKLIYEMFCWNPANRPTIVEAISKMVKIPRLPS
ncbi:MAG: hypothetical protein JWO53_62, partial [Chlamydiia bacterium]|nr:hypothetical protein [Chlamydiia bacterium]